MNFIIWLWYFSALCFHAFYSIRLNFRKWFQLSHKTWSHFLFALHCEADLLMLGLWWTCLRYDSSFSLCWKLMNQFLKLMVITFCRKRPSSVIGFLAIWAHKHAGKHMFSVNNCCLHFSISVTFLDIFCWIDWVIISEFHRWLRTINSYRHHNFGKFC